ncbi:hypothetical protein [Sphingomonas sp. NPDC079357]|uniref:hypothetical protein n=1 Tax=Sphingomonas sp. NPDC079357 TaxID=3364518 RepID=UPI00384DABB2
MPRALLRSATVALAALTLTGCSLWHFDFGRAGVRADAGATDVAAAERALRHRRWPVAVTYAEQAVARDATDGSRRALLGTAYMRAGRFRSAAQAFDDALALRQADGATALHLTLAQIASGQHDAALATLSRYAALVPVADRGLALALAGEPGQGVEVLMAAMRVPGADARTRQNLALALALAGEWPDAFFIVGLDLPPAQARRRILDWMRFARPSGPAEQVATLMKITPAIDPGQPQDLALQRGAPTAVEVAAR